MSTIYEAMSPGGHEAYATSIFSKIKTYLDSNPYGYLTTHQDISGKADKSATVSTVTWSNNKLTKTINGTTSDVVSAATILNNLTSSQVTSALGYTPASVNTTYDFESPDNSISFNGRAVGSVVTVGMTVEGKVSKDGDTISGDYINTADFSEGAISETRVTTYGAWGIDIERYLYDSLFSRLALRDNDIILDKTWGGINTSLHSSINSLRTDKVSKFGDTMSGTLLRTTVDGTAWNLARDHAFIRSHGFANDTSYFPALSFLTTGGNWSIGSLSGNNNFWFSYTRNNEYTNNINKTDNYQLVPVNDGNAHTYTIAHSGNVGTGDSNGQVKIAGTNVSVKGLGSRAYDSTSYLPTSGGTMTGIVYSSYGSATWVNSLTKSAITLTDTIGFGGWICGPTKNGRIAIATYKDGDDNFYIGYGERGRTTNSYTNRLYWTGTNGTLGTKVVIAETILRSTYISRTDTSDNGYVNHVNVGNTAYTPVRASGFVTMSCKHTKTNVVDISEEDALKLLDIRPVNFDYVEEVGGQKDQIGVLAEDTYEVLPKVVSVPDDYVEEDFDISKGIQQPLPSVDYIKFVPYLIKLVQIQQKEIDILKSKLN